MSVFDWFSAASPAGAVATVGERVVAGVFHGVSEIIRDFKLPPEQQIAFEQKMEELHTSLQVSLAQIAEQDRLSARQREMSLKDTTPSVLAYSVVGGFLSMTCGLIITSLMGYEIAPAAMGLIGTLVGYLSAKSELVLAYYFGSSAGSDRKTDLLNQK